MRRLIQALRELQARHPHLIFWGMSLPAILAFLVGVALLLISIRE